MLKNKKVHHDNYDYESKRGTKQHGFSLSITQPQLQQGVIL